MLNSGIASVVSLRARGSLSYSTDNYSHCSNVSRPFAYSSSNPCCSCCYTSIYSAPLIPSYRCSLYGLRQSSLIQWSPYRRLIPGGLDYYSRLGTCDLDEFCFCDKEIGNLREKTVRRRKGGLRKCLVYEERSERYEDGSVDEAEVLLSLLTEDIGEECYVVRKESRRLVRNPVVEKRENDEACHECGSKKKRADVGVSESETSLSSTKNDGRQRKGAIRIKEEEEFLLNGENRKASLREEHKGALLKNRTEREKVERVSLLRKASRKEEEKQERESLLRSENQKVSSRIEEKEGTPRREDHRQKLRRDESSCSSYYSLSSNGDYVSDNEIEITAGRFHEESSIGQKRNYKSDEIEYQDIRVEDQRRGYYQEDHGSTKNSSYKEFHDGSSVVESDFRKKSEKKLADVSVEEIETKKEASLQESKSSMAHESNYRRSSEYSGSYDDRKATSSGIMKLDETRKQQIMQTGEEVSRQSETMRKYKQSVERQNIHSGYVKNSSGSGKVYTGKAGMSAEVASSNQETVGEHQALVGLNTREDEYRRDSRKTAKVSEQEIDIRKTSISQQRFETNVEAEDYKNNIHSSINDAKKQKQQYVQVSGLVESTGNFQQLTREDGQSISKMESDELRNENVNLASSSSVDSKEHHSLTHARITERINSRNDSHELNKVLITHPANAGALRVEDRNKTELETLVTPPPNLPQRGALTQGSKIEIATDEDAIGSASRLEKSSAHYVGEFVKQVRNEIYSSEIQKEKETHETKVSHKESSEGSHSKDHDLGSESQQSRTKGPSDEMWKLDEPSGQETSKGEVHDNSSKAGSAIVKRTGRSLWNVIGDIVLFRWSPHSDSHSSGRKTGGRSSPNQSTSSVTWFSGHEAEEHEEEMEEKEGSSIKQGLSGSNHEEKTPSQIVESSISSQGHLRPVGINAPFCSVIHGSGSPQVNISLPTGGETSGDASSPSIMDSSIPLPGLKLRRSPAVREVSEAREAHTSDSGMSEQVNTGSLGKTESLISGEDVKQKRLLRKDQIVRDRFDEWEEAYRVEAEQRKIDEMFMREALFEAQKAADKWEVPVGSVLVHNGKIIARGCNLVEELRDSTAHAEIICIREASNMLRTWRLSETTLYVTLEPCPMCAGAILQARIDTIVWGAPNKLLGADGSWIRLFPGDGGNGVEQSEKPPAPIHPFHPKMTIRRGVLATECADVMQQFFRRRRKEDKKTEAPSTPPSCLPLSNRPSKFLAKMHDAFNMMLCL